MCGRVVAHVALRVAAHLLHGWIATARYELVRFLRGSTRRRPRLLDLQDAFWDVAGYSGEPELGDPATMSIAEKTARAEAINGVTGPLRAVLVPTAAEIRASFVGELARAGYDERAPLG